MKGNISTKRKIATAMLVTFGGVVWAGVPSSVWAAPAEDLPPAILQICPSKPATAGETVQTPEVSALADFSWQMYQTTVAKQTENVLVSPLSAYFALAMTSQGAAGDTAAEFGKLFQGMTAEEQKECGAWLMRWLTNTGGDTKLQVANSIWYDADLTVQRSFSNTLQQYFEAEVLRKEFADPKTVVAINQWINDQTEGLIPKMLEELSPAQKMLLINTIYLNAQWQQPFAAEKTHKATFTNGQGKQQTVDMMRSDILQGQYVQTEQGEAVLLPYNDGKLAFVAFLPDAKQTAAATAAVLDGDLLQQLTAQQARPLVVEMPKFEVEYGLKLNNVLQQMGLQKAFAADQADFSGMTGDGVPLSIDEVLQRCVLRVDEKGTEAAAVTVVSMRMTSAPLEPEYHQINFNRPFHYAVVDLQTGLPLFTGLLQTVQAPKA